MDKPVSNSGRVKKIIEEKILDYDLDWQVTLSNDPDKELITADSVIASSDSVILSQCSKWINLNKMIMAQDISSANIIDMSNK